MLMDFYVKCGVFWAFSTAALLLVARGGVDLDWWAPVSVLWDVAFILAPPIGIIGFGVLGGIFGRMQIRARERAGIAPREPEGEVRRERSRRARAELDEMRRERSRRARAELDEMRRERERVEGAKVAGEGEAG